MVDFIFTFCEILIVISYIFTNLFVLRLITVIGMSGYVLGGFIAGINIPGMKAIIVFSLLNVVINIIQIIKIFLDRMPVFLPDDLKNIYLKNFNNMTTREFVKLKKFTEFSYLKKGTVLTTENEPVEYLSLLVNGTVNILKNGIKLLEVGPGFFLGEMSFLTNQIANATVIAKEDIEVMQWNKKELMQLEKKDVSLYTKLKNTLALDLIKKIDLNAKYKEQF